MHILPYFPPNIAGAEWRHRLGLIKRQLLVLLKMKNDQFASYSTDLKMFFRTYFFFQPADEELLSLVVRVLKRFLQVGNSIDFLVFLDCIDSVQQSDAKFVSQYLTNVPDDFYSMNSSKFKKAIELMNNSSSGTLKRTFKPVDETIALLDDKSFVKEFKQSFIDSQYEDEYVDNEDFPENCLSGNATLFADFSDSEVILFEAFMKDPVALGKSRRNHPERARLCSQLKLSHEQIEGWAVMLSRNPNQEAILRRFVQWKTDTRRRKERS